MYELANDPWAVFNSLFIIILIGAPLALAAAMIHVYIKLVNEGKKLEAGLNTVFLEAQNYLSHSVILISEMLQINKRESETLERTLSDAISGRYRNSTGSRDALMSFLQENYPDLHSFSASFNRIDSAVSSSRSAFTQIQNRLLSELKTFEQWRTGTFMSRMFVGKKFPDGDLIARAGGRRYIGKEALEKMYQIIQTEDGIEAYNRGTYEPMRLY